LTATGNDDGQSISGNGSDNTIHGLGGDDNLRGLGGDDTFVFDTTDFGNDRIADFESGDMIDLSALGFNSIADMQAQGVTFIGSVIDFTGAGIAGTIDLNKVDAMTLTDADFDFGI
ncbi:MAG: hypothetical protein AAF253_12460, partial [Pseudomonadota bacterium]